MTTAVHSGPVEVLPPGEAVPSNSRWHELRRAGITASEIACILGISPWESPFSTYWRKTNGWEIDDNLDMDAGRRIEPVIADWFADQNLDFVVCPAGLYAHPERLWQLATPDRLVCDPQMHDNPFPDDPDYHYDHNTDAWKLAVLECKHPYSWDGFGDDGTDQIPVWYRAQILWQMDVLGVDTGHLAAYSGHRFRSYTIRRDEKDLAVMRHAGAAFMRRLAEGDPPDVDEHTATLATLKRLHPTVDDYDVQVDLNTAEGYRRARAMKARAEALVDRYEARLRAAIGTGRWAMCNRRLVASRTVYDRKPYTVGPTTVDRLTPGRSDSYDS